MIRKQGVGSRIGPDLRERIKALAMQGYLPADIQRELGGGVSLPVVRGVWKEYQPPDGSSPWSLFDCDDPSEARLILAMQRWLREWSDGRIRSITNDEARIMVRLQWISPGLDAGPLFMCAREYIRARQRGDDTSELDIQYAYVGDQAGWDKAVAAGIVSAEVDRETWNAVLEEAGHATSK